MKYNPISKTELYKCVRLKERERKVTSKCFFFCSCLQMMWTQIYFPWWIFFVIILIYHQPLWWAQVAPPCGWVHRKTQATHWSSQGAKLPEANLPASPKVFLWYQSQIWYFHKILENVNFFFFCFHWAILHKCVVWDILYNVHSVVMSIFNTVWATYRGPVARS